MVPIWPNLCPNLTPLKQTLTFGLMSVFFPFSISIASMFLMMARRSPSSWTPICDRSDSVNVRSVSMDILCLANRGMYSAAPAEVRTFFTAISSWLSYIGNIRNKVHIYLHVMQKNSNQFWNWIFKANSNLRTIFKFD